MQVTPSSVEGYLGRRVPDCFPATPEVRRIAEISAGVWEVEMEGGDLAVAKHQVYADCPGNAADDLLAVEEKVLELLEAASCKVPRVLGTDPDTRFIFFEHRGRLTADDLCQTAVGGPRTEFRRQVVDDFCEIETALAAHEEELLPLVSVAGTREHLKTRDAASLQKAEKGVARCLRASRNTSSEIRDLMELFRAISDELVERQPTLGSMDYNARNIVVDESGQRPCFVEFAKIGWDWPERRLVQYGTSLGAQRDEGRIVGLISGDAARWYVAGESGDRCGRALALDGHHLHFNLNALAMLSSALDQPDKPANRALLVAWRRPQERMRQLMEAVATPLSDDPMCREFRRSIAAMAGFNEEG